MPDQAFRWKSLRSSGVAAACRGPRGVFRFAAAERTMGTQHFVLQQSRVYHPPTEHWHIADLKSADDVSTVDAKDVRIEHGEKAGWLAPIELEPKRKKVREKSSSRRASNRGCVFMSLPEYLRLLDWTGRQLKPGKRGSVAKTAPPILERLDLSPELWLQVVEQFGKRRAANRVTPASRFNAAVPSSVPTSVSRRT